MTNYIEFSVGLLGGVSARQVADTLNTSGGIFEVFVRPMYAFGRPNELRSRGLINFKISISILSLKKI